MRCSVVSVWVVLLLFVTTVSSASAQLIGNFEWQFAPFCNVITVSVTQIGSTFTLDGFDDQCGAATRAAIVGTAFPNPNGTIGIGLSLVATPGAAPVHVDVALNLATIGGPWRDSFGNTGMFVFNPPSPAPGAPRPATGGLISTIAPGAGLSGGGTTGAVSLAVAFNGSGAADSAARSDHTHAAAGTANTAIGLAALGLISSGAGNTAAGALALDALTSGSLNSAFGFGALGSLTTGGTNTAVGSSTLGSAVIATGNTAIGTNALSSTLANYNTAVGSNALRANENGTSNTAVGHAAMIASDGNENTAIGQSAFSTLNTGIRNIAIGWSAGGVLTDGSNNIYLGGDAAAAVENSTMRLGTVQTASYMVGVYNQAVNGGSDQPVLMDNTGKLGTVLSSGRFKRDIQPLGALSTAILKLEPVSFRYMPEQQRGEAVQFGLIAEQVADVLPELVIRDSEGQPLTVKYQLLPALLLAEIQRLERERLTQAEAMAAQARAIEELREELRILRSERR